MRFRPQEPADLLAASLAEHHQRLRAGPAPLPWPQLGWARCDVLSQLSRAGATCEGALWHGERTPRPWESLDVAPGAHSEADRLGRLWELERLVQRLVASAPEPGACALAALMRGGHAL